MILLVFENPAAGIMFSGICVKHDPVKYGDNSPNLGKSVNDEYHWLWNH